MSDITKEQTDRLVKALRLGHFRKSACDYAGISYSNFSAWMRIGETEPDSVQGVFRKLVLQSEADPETCALETIHSALNEGDWKAAAWWLERRKRKSWGKQEAQKPAASVNNNFLTLDLKKLSQEQLSALEQIMHALEPGKAPAIPVQQLPEHDPNSNIPNIQQEQLVRAVEHFAAVEGDEECTDAEVIELAPCKATR